MKKTDQPTDKPAIEELTEEHKRFAKFLAETFVKAVIERRI